MRSRRDACVVGILVAGGDGFEAAAVGMVSCALLMVAFEIGTGIRVGLTDSLDGTTIVEMAAAGCCCCCCCGWKTVEILCSQRKEE